MDALWDDRSDSDDSEFNDDLFFDFSEDDSDSDDSDFEPDHFMPTSPPIDRVHYQPHQAFTQGYSEGPR